MNHLLAAIETHLGIDSPKRLGVAVSGGGDSVALLFALVKFCRTKNIQLHTITINHGLRANVEDEINHVSHLCTKWGISHDVKYWGGYDGSGNLQAKAREARYSLIAEWAKSKHIEMVALGHNADDQAETFLMNLSRASGVDGLSGMQISSRREGITWLRPFLGVTRSNLRDVLRKEKISWFDDPSNESDKFTRIRMREALPILESLGIKRTTLAEVASQMGEAKDALDQETQNISKKFSKFTGGAIAIDSQIFASLPKEISRRLMIKAIKWTSQNIYPPRREALAHVIDEVMNHRGTVINGCQISFQKNMIWVSREFNAIKDLQCPINQIWDGKWKVNGYDKGSDHLRLRALGQDGLIRIKDRRRQDIPASVLAVSPSIWNGNDLIAAPLADPSSKWNAEIVGEKWNEVQNEKIENIKINENDSPDELKI